MEDKIKEINERFAHYSPQEVLKWFVAEYRGRIALSSSLGPEDQVLTDMLMAIDRYTEIFTLDTGRLFPETYSLIDRTNMRYGIKLKIYFPDSGEVEAMSREHGVNLFYETVDKRRECCRMRKLGPLARAFEGLEVWICGLRRAQSVTRADMRMVEWDSANGLIKLNPLIDWTEEQVWEYICGNGVPYNKLHDKGFRSIGCQPCTRAVADGEDERAGRWWWESPEQKECGLHKR